MSTGTADIDILLGRAGAGLADAGLASASRDDVVAHLGRWLRGGSAADADAVAALVDAGEWFLLADAFAGALAARGGVLRGAVGHGPNRLNPRVVAAAAAAHAEGLGDGLVVIAWDGRRHADLLGQGAADRGDPLFGVASVDLARVAAEVYTARGLTVLWPSEVAGRALALPEVSALVRRRGAVGGLYVGAGTAHPDESGCTFLGADGAPAALPAFDSATASVRLPFGEAEAVGRVRVLADLERDHWYAETNALAPAAPSDEPRTVRVAYSPLAGVAAAATAAGLVRAGVDVVTVREQAVQDPAFASVPFRRPDPRRPGALAAAVAVAIRAGADLAIASDGVGARLGAAAIIPPAGPSESAGSADSPSVRPLEEDEVAALLADHVFARGGGGVLLTNPLVTPLAERIAAAHGARVIADLAPGFAAVGAALRADPPSADSRSGGAPFLAFGDGGAVTARPDVLVGDAAGAALLLADLADREKAAGRTLVDTLRALWRRHGYARTRRRVLRFEGPGSAFRGAAVVAALESAPPRRVAGRDVEAVRLLPDGAGLVLTLERDARAVVARAATDDALEVVASVATGPLGADTDELRVMRALGETDGEAGAILEDLVLQAAARQEIALPRTAFAVPDFVGVDLVAHFFGTFLPELEVRAQEVLARYTTDADAKAWVAEALDAYGPDTRTLLAPGLEAHLGGLRAVVGERGRPVLELIRTLFGGAGEL